MRSRIILAIRRGTADVVPFLMVPVSVYEPDMSSFNAKKLDVSAIAEECLAHTLLTPYRSVGVTGGKGCFRSMWNQLLTTGSDRIGGPESGSIPVSATMFSQTYG